MTDSNDRERSPDELDRVARELRDVLRADAAGAQVDWERIGRLRAAHRQRRRRRIVVAGGLAAASVAAVVVAWSLSGSSPGEGSREAAPAVAGPAAAPAEAGAWRVLHEAGMTRVVAGPGTRAAWDGFEEVRLDAGRVVVRFRRGDGPGAAQTLCVRAPELRACAHGTMFEVAVSESAAGGSAVTVVEGTVRVDRPGASPIDVPAGHRLAAPYAQPQPAAGETLARVAAAVGSPAAAAPPEPPPLAAAAPPEAVEAAGEAVSGAGPAGGASPEEAAIPGPAGPQERAAAPVASARAAGTDLEAIYRAAERALAEGRPDDAVVLLARVADASPGTALGGQAMMDIGETRLRGGRPAPARNAFVRYLAEHPRGALRAEARIKVCRIDTGAGRLADALACYAAYLAEFPAGAYAAEARQATGAADGESGREER